MNAMGMLRTFGMGALAVLAPLACSETTGPDGLERTGVIRWFASAEAVDGDPTWPDDGGAVLEAPETVAAGEPFGVVVWTVGNSGCWEAEGMEVENDPSLASLVPVDFDGTRQGIMCTAALVELRHAADLVFTEAGEATIRVEGRTVIGEDFSEGEAFSIERTVTVTP